MYLKYLNILPITYPKPIITTNNMAIISSYFSVKNERALDNNAVIPIISLFINLSVYGGGKMDILTKITLLLFILVHIYVFIWSITFLLKYFLKKWRKKD